jgi:hypothetical protein
MKLARSVLFGAVLGLIVGCKPSPLVVGGQSGALGACNRDCDCQVGLTCVHNVCQSTSNDMGPGGNRDGSPSTDGSTDGGPIYGYDAGPDSGWIYGSSDMAPSDFGCGQYPCHPDLAR